MGIRPIRGRDMSFAGVFVVAWLAMIAVYVLIVTFWGTLQVFDPRWNRRWNACRTACA